MSLSSRNRTDSIFDAFSSREPVTTSLKTLCIHDGGSGAADTQPSRIPSRRDYLSCESGIWMSLLMCLMGPADDGMMSKSKISVGSHSVAQALGTSTTPEMWPWHGAVPRIE